jgi:NAD(P)-dependent dehydrogenase (short-subunit alcohol dehydrogenase family)
MKSFAGKVAAITGAASGMGRSLSIALARRGCEVAISDVDEVGLAETARLAKAASSVRVTAKRVDVSDESAVRSWAQLVASEHGRCNLVFNNAGIAYVATIEGGDPAEFERIIDIDFWGVVHGTRAFLPFLRASGDGHVINTSSVFGLIAFPGNGSYNAAKFAVRGFTEALRIELEMSGAPVSATCVHPGGIKTNIARASKVHPSMADLGIDDLEEARNRFERGFRVSADDAAETILRGVQKNARRVLIGVDAHVIDLMQRIVPGRYHGLLVHVSRRVLGGRASASRQPAAESSGTPVTSKRPPSARATSN